MPLHPKSPMAVAHPDPPSSFLLLHLPSFTRVPFLLHKRALMLPPPQPRRLPELPPQTRPPPSSTQTTTPRSPPFSPNCDAFYSLSAFSISISIPSTSPTTPNPTDNFDFENAPKWSSYVIINFEFFKDLIFLGFVSFGFELNMLVRGRGVVPLPAYDGLAIVVRN